MATDDPVVVDLFSGAGGMSLGFRVAWCRILAGVDEDDGANATLLENFTHLQPDAPPFVPAPEEGDLHDFDLDGVRGDENIDSIIGGPPCQGFSRMGRAKLDSLRDEGQRDEGSRKTRETISTRYSCRLSGSGSLRGFRRPRPRFQTP